MNRIKTNPDSQFVNGLFGAIKKQSAGKLVSVSGIGQHGSTVGGLVINQTINGKNEMNIKAAISEKRQQITNLVNEVENIAAKCEKENRSETTAEIERLKAITDKGGLLDTLGGELTIMEQRERTMTLALAQAGSRLDERMRDGGIFTESIVPQMTNQFGQEIHCVTKDQKVSAIYGSERVQNGVGHLIRARVCGFGRNTPDAVRNAMSTGSDQAGGIMVPDILSGDLIDLARAKSVLVGLGMQTLICSGSTTTIAKVVQQPTPEVKSEMASFTPQDFTLTGVGLNPRTVGVYLECSRELVQDAPNFVQIIEDQLSKTLATYVDRYGLVGFGGTSIGLADTTLISETAASGAITWPKVATAATNVKVANHTPTGGVLAPAMHDALMNQASGDGTNSAKLWQTAPPSLANVSFVDSTNMTATKLVVGDFTKYAMGLWSGFQIEVSSAAGDMFKKHGVAIKITARLDYAILDSSAFYRLTGLTVS